MRPDPRRRVMPMLVLCLAGVSSEARAAQTDAKWWSAAAHAFDARLPAMLEEAAVPGASLALIDGTDVVWAGAYGTRGPLPGRPVTSRTVFEVASLSKSITAVVALLLTLEMNGAVLGLDTPLATALRIPVAGRDTAAASRITLRHILSHQTGLINWREPGQDLRFIAGPGKFSYSGEAFQYLGELIEQVTGRELDTLASDLLARPAGVDGAGFVWTDRLAGDFASGRDGGAELTKFEPDRAFAAYGYHASAVDFARLIAHFMGPSFPTVLRERALVPQVQADSGVAWGLGWGLELAGSAPDGPPRAFFHHGANRGFRALSLYDLERGRGIVILTNGDAGWRLLPEIIGHVTDAGTRAVRWCCS